MCVVIAKPKGVQIRKSYLKNCYLSNPDGAGFMYVKDGEIVIDKGYFNFELFYSSYEQAERENRKSPFVIHFRIATSGGVNLENCHPFEIDEHNAFAHNGIFYSLSYAQSKFSDTQIFNNTLLKNLPPNWNQWHGIKTLIESYAKEASSKLVFLNDHKEVWICGETDGMWYKGAWYSNAAYEPVKHFGFRQNWYEYSDKETDYIDHNATNDTKQQLLLGSTVKCDECGVVTSMGDAIYMNEFGYVCEDCWEEYQGVLKEC